MLDQKVVRNWGLLYIVLTIAKPHRILMIKPQVTMGLLHIRKLQASQTL